MRKPSKNLPPYTDTPEYVGSFDPGTAKCGVAVSYWGRIVAAKTIHRPTPTQVGRFFHKHIRDFDLAEFVRELMVHRVDFRVAHKDLKNIEAAADVIALEVLERKWDRTWEPLRWKGGVPKDVHHPRVEAGALFTPDELTLWNLAGEDGRDAIALNLFATRRINRTGRTQRALAFGDEIPE